MLLQTPLIEVQGISEKCTVALKSLKFGCRIIFWSIYLSKSLFIYRIHKKKSYHVLILKQI